MNDLMKICAVLVVTGLSMSTAIIMVRTDDNTKKVHDKPLYEQGQRVKKPHILARSFYINGRLDRKP